MRQIFYFIIIASLIQGCKKADESTHRNGISGKFSFSCLSSNLKSAKTIESNDSTSFVLDTVKSSRSFYFILGNSGQEDITNVSISTNNSSFNVTPSTIAILPGTNSKNSSTITQVVSLDIVHGTRINGVGYAGLLNMGDNSCYITIQGQTNDGASNIPVKLKAKIDVYAKVMAISLYQGKNVFDLTKPTNKIFGGPYDIDQMNYFDYYSNNPPIVLKNIGNVSFTMTFSNFDANNTILQNTSLKPQDTIVLNLSTKSTAFGAGGEIRLNSNGTIFDQQKLSLGRDGNGYFAMMFNQQQSPIVTPPNDSIK